MEFSENSMEGLVPNVLQGTLLRHYSDDQLLRTERGLEREIRRESFVPPPGRRIARLRHKGEQVLHSKHVLLAVVILNLVDCGLVLGELILDIHYIRDLRGETERTTQKFIDEMQARYPGHLQGYTIRSINKLHQRLYQATCHWPKPNQAQNISKFTANNVQYSHHNLSNSAKSLDNIEHEMAFDFYSKGNRTDMDHNFTNVINERENYSEVVDAHQKEQKLWEDIAHGLHKASITILGILFLENFVKLLCMGRGFFTKKLEVFDALVVVVSFVVDLVLLKGLTEFAVQDALFILSFLLPWRVIRVVNSLIVAILDHEHFQLKMLYKEKKLVSERLRALQDKEKRWDFHLQKIESFCESEGIPKWKIRQHTAMGRKQSTVTSMASLALNGFLQGLVLSPSDKDLFNKTIERSIAVNMACSSSLSPETAPSSSSLSAITEHDDGVKEDKGDNAVRDRKGKAGVAKSAPDSKRVSFDSREKKPLLLRQESVDTEQSEVYEADDD